MQRPTSAPVVLEPAAVRRFAGRIDHNRPPLKLKCDERVSNRTDCTFVANKAIINGTRLTVYGNNNRISGSGIVVYGSQNHVIGSGCDVAGDSNTVNGSGCRCVGLENKVIGVNSVNVEKAVILPKTPKCPRNPRPFTSNPAPLPHVESHDMPNVVMPDSIRLALENFVRCVNNAPALKNDDDGIPELLLSEVSGEDEKANGGIGGTCVICQENKPKLAPAECGHHCMCLSCARTIIDGDIGGQKCPICRVLLHKKLVRVRIS